MPRPDKPRRLIDRLRESGGSAKVPPAFGNIVTLRPSPSQHRLYILAERGVCSSVMADQIDPERQNIDIPFVVQREELAYGTETLFVRRTVGAGMQLLNATYLPAQFATERAFEIIMAAAQELASIADIIRDLSHSEAAVRARMAGGEVMRSHLPRTPDLRTKARAGLASLRSVQVAAADLANLFYPRSRPNVPWAASLLASARRSLPASDPYIDSLVAGTELLQKLADYRNADVHPDQTKWTRFIDYDLQPDGNIVAPTIEVAHPSSPVPREDIVRFLEDHLDAASGTLEMFLGGLCDRNAGQMGMFENRVAHVPDGGVRAGSHLFWETRVRDGFDFPPKA